MALYNSIAKFIKNDNDFILGFLQVYEKVNFLNVNKEYHNLKKELNNIMLNRNYSRTFFNYVEDNDGKKQVSFDDDMLLKIVNTYPNITINIFPFKQEEELTLLIEKISKYLNKCKDVKIWVHASTIMEEKGFFEKYHEMFKCYVNMDIKITNMCYGYGATSIFLNIRSLTLNEKDNVNISSLQNGRIECLNLQSCRNIVLPIDLPFINSMVISTSILNEIPGYNSLEKFICLYCNIDKINYLKNLVHLHYENETLETVFFNETKLKKIIISIKYILIFDIFKYLDNAILKIRNNPYSYEFKTNIIDNNVFTNIINLELDNCPIVKIITQLNCLLTLKIITTSQEILIIEKCENLKKMNIKYDGPGYKSIVIQYLTQIKTIVLHDLQIINVNNINSNVNVNINNCKDIDKLINNTNVVKLCCENTDIGIFSHYNFKSLKTLSIYGCSYLQDDITNIYNVTKLSLYDDERTNNILDKIHNFKKLDTLILTNHLHNYTFHNYYIPDLELKVIESLSLSKLSYNIKYRSLKVVELIMVPLDNLTWSKNLDKLIINKCLINDLNSFQYVKHLLLKNLPDKAYIDTTNILKVLIPSIHLESCQYKYLAPDNYDNYHMYKNDYETVFLLK